MQSQSSNGKKVIRLNPARSSKHFTNYKKFKDIDLDEARSKVIFNLSIIQSYQYSHV